MIFVVGGGGGKLKNTDAVIVATVPTGSTVTATKSGTTLTPTMWVASSQISNAGVSIPSGATIQNVVGGSGSPLGTYVLETRQLDVSNLSGEYYIGFHGGRGGGSGDGWPQVHLLKAYLKK